MNRRRYTGSPDIRWKVGDTPDRVQLEDLVLVSLHNVARGSWQPHFRLCYSEEYN